jgi:hypothetical protein
MTSVFERRGPDDRWECLGTVRYRAAAEEAVSLFRRFGPPMEYRLEDQGSNHDKQQGRVLQGPSLNRHS